MSLKTIRKAFETRLATWAASQSLPVAYQNKSIARPSTAFIEVFILPGQTTSQYMAQNDRSYIGLCQVNIHVAKDAGSAPAADYANAIAALYGVSMVQDGLRIFTQPMYELPDIPSDTHYTLPIRIPYRCEVA
jgi:hypothetical protein